MSSAELFSAGAGAGFGFFPLGVVSLPPHGNAAPNR
jgi:hypothetical protein